MPSFWVMKLSKVLFSVPYLFAIYSMTIIQDQTIEQDITQIQTIMQTQTIEDEITQFTTIETPVTQVQTIGQTIEVPVTQTQVQTVIQSVTQIQTIENDVTNFVTEQVQVTQVSTVETTLTEIITQDQVLTQQITRQETVTVQTVQTQKSTTVVLVTAYSTAPACSATPTILNPSFEDYQLTSDPNSFPGWIDNQLDPGQGYGITPQTQYAYNGSASAGFAFNESSMATNNQSLSQQITLCPFTSYQFSMHATTKAGDTGSCFAQICMYPDIGASACGALQHLFSGNDPVYGWTTVELTFANDVVDSTSGLLTVGAYCIDSSPVGELVFLDDVAVMAV